jgi:ubiquinone/menaquinone biosynthesis C-methylase UbiE
VLDWGLGTYERIAEKLLPAAEVVVEQAGLTGGETVIDVGCGTGNAALLAAEAGTQVIGIDPAERLIEVAAAAAEQQGLDAEFVVGEAASMPVSASEADVLLSVFGVVFAPDARAAAAEMDRVTKSDGRILISAWIPEGAVSTGVRKIRETMAEITGQQGDPPFPWHDEAAVTELFEPHGRLVRFSEHTIAFTAPSAREWVEGESRDHPMSVAARPLLEQAGRGEELQRRLIEHYESANEHPDEFRVTSRYVVAEITPR